MTATTFGRTVAREDELVRHSTYTRILHWSTAIFFILSLLSGLAIYSPWLYHWMAPLFGGGARTRLLHPWFSLGFSAVFVLQFLNWLGPMTWRAEDTRWIRRIRDYVTNHEKREPDYVGFFNGGQKMYFWAIVASTVIFVITGLVLWFPPHGSGRIVVAISYVLHDIAMLLMLVGFIVHIYEGTAAAPGTFRAMTRGTVSKRWAWTHHPRWYREAASRQSPAASRQSD
jgi:formate dehydrogenase subunit gamma